MPVPPPVTMATRPVKSRSSGVITLLTQTVCIQIVIPIAHRATGSSVGNLSPATSALTGAYPAAQFLGALLGRYHRGIGGQVLAQLGEGHALDDGHRAAVTIEPAPVDTAFRVAGRIEPVGDAGVLQRDDGAEFAIRAHPGGVAV